MGKKTKHAEIAFFGGSFTAIDREYMIDLLEIASNSVKLYDFTGIRISTRPDKIDVEILDILRKYGVTAIELGAQSMDNDVLLSNERGHDALSVIKASNLIKEQGFELGLQMMTGLYMSTKDKDISTALEIIKLSPKTVRIYPTITLESTLLCDLFKSGEYIPPSLEETVDLCAVLLELFEENNINVIRVGLHSSEEISMNKVAGPYHPAFKELVLSEIYRKKLLICLDGLKNGEYIVKVNPKMVSIISGQKKSNILYFKNLGYDLKLKQDKNTLTFDIIELGNKICY